MLSVSNFVKEEDYFSFNKWLSVSAVKHVAGDNEQLLAKFWRNMQSRTPEEAGWLENADADILTTTALIELLVPVKHVIFMPTTGPHSLLSSDVWSYQNKYLDSKGD